MARGVDYGRRALGWMQSLAPALRRLATVLKVIAIVGLLAPLASGLMLLVEYWPPGLRTFLVLAAVYVVLAFCPWGLLSFAGSIESLAGMPDAIAQSPELYRRHQDEIVQLYRDVGDPQTGRVSGVGRGAVGGLKLLWRMRKELPDYEGVLALGRLGLVVVAALGVLMAIVNVALVPFVAAGVLVNA